MKDTDNKTSVLFSIHSYFVIDTQCDLKYIQNNKQLNQLSIDIRLSINIFLSAIKQLNQNGSSFTEIDQEAVV